MLQLDINRERIKVEIKESVGEQTDYSKIEQEHEIKYTGTCVRQYMIDVAQVPIGDKVRGSQGPHLYCFPPTFHALSRRLKCQQLYQKFDAMFHIPIPCGSMQNDEKCVGSSLQDVSNKVSGKVQNKNNDTLGSVKP